MDDQQPFFFVAHEIETALGISPGAAQTHLRELCKSGEVRSWKQPYSMRGGEPQGEGPPQRIEPSEWRQHEIDLMVDNEGCRYFVNVSEADFKEWLKAKQNPQRGGKQPRILKHLAEMFPNERVPEPSDYPRKALRADLIKRDPNLKPLDEATLKSAIDTHNAAIAG